MAEFFVVVVNGDERDSHAATELSEAIKLANPDNGSRVAVYLVEAGDAGAARLSVREGSKVFDQPFYRKD